MSKKPTKTTSSPKQGPFDADLFAEAERIAFRYKLILEPHAERGFVGTALEFPTCFADGATPNQCVDATREALTVVVAAMLEIGNRPPTPAVDKRRDVQLNIRLTADEKQRLQSAANAAGFDGVSDFVRNAALKRARTTG